MEDEESSAACRSGEKVGVRSNRLVFDSEERGATDVGKSETEEGN